MMVCVNLVVFFRKNKIQRIDIAVAACGHRMDQAIVLIKSAAIMTHINMSIHVFTFAKDIKVFRGKVNKEVRNLQFHHFSNLNHD